MIANQLIVIEKIHLFLTVAGFVLLFLLFKKPLWAASFLLGGGAVSCNLFFLKRIVCGFLGLKKYTKKKWAALLVAKYSIFFGLCLGAVLWLRLEVIPFAMGVSMFVVASLIIGFKGLLSGTRNVV